MVDLSYGQYVRQDTIFGIRKTIALFTYTVLLVQDAVQTDMRTTVTGASGVIFFPRTYAKKNHFINTQQMVQRNERTCCHLASLLGLKQKNRSFHCPSVSR
jgi:hypothetical protein